MKFIRAKELSILFGLIIILTQFLPFVLANLDSDWDGIENGPEIGAGTNPEDADTDNDGILDGDETDWNKDTDGDGTWEENTWTSGNYNTGINALDWDSDNDNIPDGTEAGITDAHPSTYYNQGATPNTGDNNDMYWYPMIFQNDEPPDKDGNTTTDPLLNDTDGDGLFDGWDDINGNGLLDAGELGEDKNANGRVDDGETDPSKPDSDGGGINDGEEVQNGYNPLDPNDDKLLMDIDKDGVKDANDAFPSDPTQWKDSDGDGYGDNPSGKNPDAFPSDSTQWIDSDGDGYGDNPSGNNPDEFPNDPTKHEDTSDGNGGGDGKIDDGNGSNGGGNNSGDIGGTTGDDSGSEIIDTGLLMILLIVIVIIIVIILAAFFVMKKRKEKDIFKQLNPQLQTPQTQQPVQQLGRIAQPQVLQAQQVQLQQPPLQPGQVPQQVLQAQPVTQGQVQLQQPPLQPGQFPVQQVQHTLPYQGPGNVGNICPKCSTSLNFVLSQQRWFCSKCKKYS